MSDHETERGTAERAAEAPPRDIGGADHNQSGGAGNGGGAKGISSGLQPGGTAPAGGRQGGFGSLGTGGGSTPSGKGSGTLPPDRR